MTDQTDKWRAAYASARASEHHFAADSLTEAADHAQRLHAALDTILLNVSDGSYDNPSSALENIANALSSVGWENDSSWLARRDAEVAAKAAADAWDEGWKRGNDYAMVRPTKGADGYWANPYRAAASSLGAENPEVNR